MSAAKGSEQGHRERWALILGVSSGTGAAVARALARNNKLHVFGCHRGNHPEAAAQLQADLEALGQKGALTTLDAGNAEAAALGAGAVLERCGPGSVQVFVHAIANASVGRLASGDARQLAPRQLQKTIDSMASSFVYWTQELLARDLLAPSALLLGLSNPMDDLVLRGTAAIAASKAALGVYVRHLAHELGPRGHRVNLLKFGAVVTAAVRRTFGEERLARLSEVLTRAIPAGRLGTCEEVAELVTVLASPAGSWFNGATIDFTGGESQGFFDVLVNPERED